MNMGAVITFPIILPDDETLHAAAQQACARHLHLVIDEHGHFRLTPFVLPGMQKMFVLDKSLRNAA